MNGGRRGRSDGPRIGRVRVDRTGRSASGGGAARSSWRRRRRWLVVAFVVVGVVVAEAGQGQGGGFFFFFFFFLHSPKLRLRRPSSAFNPFAFVTRLPSMAAAARAAHGTVMRAQLADVERYARTEYLLDLTSGKRDAAVARRSARIAEFTGLNMVRRHDGLIDNRVFLHELYRAQGRVGSSYDATITIADPFPLETRGEHPDPVLEGLRAPVSSAIAAEYPGDQPVGLGQPDMEPAAVHAGDAYRTGARSAFVGADRARSVRSGDAIHGDAVAARSGAGNRASPSAFISRSIRAATCSTPTTPRRAAFRDEAAQLFGRGRTRSSNSDPAHASFRAARSCRYSSRW